MMYSAKFKSSLLMAVLIAYSLGLFSSLAMGTETGVLGDNRNWSNGYSMSGNSKVSCYGETFSMTLAGGQFARIYSIYARMSSSADYCRFGIYNMTGLSHAEYVNASLIAYTTNTALTGAAEWENLNIAFNSTGGAIGYIDLLSGDYQIFIHVDSTVTIYRGAGAENGYEEYHSVADTYGDGPGSKHGSGVHNSDQSIAMYANYVLLGGCSIYEDFEDAGDNLAVRWDLVYWSKSHVGASYAQNGTYGLRTFVNASIQNIAGRYIWRNSTERQSMNVTFWINGTLLELNGNYTEIASLRTSSDHRLASLYLSNQSNNAGFYFNNAFNVTYIHLMNWTGGFFDWLRIEIDVFIGDSTGYVQIYIENTSRIQVYSRLGLANYQFGGVGRCYFSTVGGVLQGNVLDLRYDDIILECGIAWLGPAVTTIQINGLLLISGFGMIFLPIWFMGAKRDKVQAHQVIGLLFVMLIGFALLLAVAYG